jgi:hypothetical protein
MEKQKVKEYKIEKNENITKFIEIISKLSTLEIVYRGQHHREDFQLIPTIGRLYKIFSENGTKFFRWQAYYDVIINEFKNKAIPYLETIPNTNIEWQIHGQHHGLVTQLLDWTFNPLVALFFALEDKNDYQCNDKKLNEVKYVVYAIEGPISNFQNIDKNNQTRDDFDIINPPSINRRIIAQQSCFTFHSFPKAFDARFKPLDDIISESPVLPDVYFLIKILIHEKCREMMLNELNSIGINRHTLFPDLDGLAKYINWKYKRNLVDTQTIQDILLKQK